MLGKPEVGWSLFQLDEGMPVYDLSYLTDVAVEWLDQAIQGLSTLRPFSVHGVCEPGRIICTVSYWNCHLLYEGEDREDTLVNVHSARVSMIDFCRRLHADVERDFSAWVHWDDSGEDETASVGKTVQRRRCIREKLDRLGALIEEKEDRFGEHRCFL